MTDSRKVAVITGGASGIGLAITRRAARDGYAVAALDVNKEGVDAVSKELTAAGHSALGLTVDISDRDQVDRAVETIRAELGPIGVLVTSAAIAPQQPFAELTPEMWNQVLAINLTGTFHCIQSMLPDMIESKWGRVVLISSSSAQRGAPRMAHYAASKGGIIALTKALAVEHGGLGVTFNNIAPSSVMSPSLQKKQDEGKLPSSEVLSRNIPVGRMGEGDDIAGACSYLMSDDASFVTGQTLSVNGGSFIG